MGNDPMISVGKLTPRLPRRYDKDVTNSTMRSRKYDGIRNRYMKSKIRLEKRDPATPDALDTTLIGLQR